MSAKFVVKSSGKGKFTFNLQAANGKVILSSEVYSSKNAALKGIESVRKNAGKASNFERRTAKNGKIFFVLLGGNKETVGQSQMYASSDSAQKGIESVKTNARSAKLEDRTGA
jgi:uncharacterized protein YegP (UPF0339 family)